MAFHKTMLVAEQAGKTLLIGAMTGQEIVGALRSHHIRVNPHAQRSLMKGAHKETTAELLDNDRIEAMPRMKSFLKFADRVMRQLKEGNNMEGFFGAIQLVIPDTFEGARLVTVDPDAARGGPYEVVNALKALGAMKLAAFEARPSFNEPVLHLADGQARCFLMHSLERVAKKRIIQQQKLIRKAEKSHESTDELKATLADMEAHLREVQTFLSHLHLGVIIYADSVGPDGAIKGLPVNAEQRLYIEGNALNSQASQEEVLKYEQYSPVILALRDIREGFTWMSDEYIEADSKTVSSSSGKLFTLSALVQAFSYSIVDNNQPLKKFETDLVEKVGQHLDFVEQYWARITEIFGPTWVPEVDQKPGERLSYLESLRGQGRRNVTFQAVFLLALGRLGYEMGVAAGWDPESDLLNKLDRLDPSLVQYDAERTVLKEGVPTSEWEKRWTDSMMKPSVKDGVLVGYAFNNSRENIETTFRLLASLVDFTPTDKTTAEPATAPMELEDA